MAAQQTLKEYAKYVTLNVLGMTGLSCYILADTYFISKGLGANGLTALNLAIPVYSFIHGSGLMLGMGGATKFSIFRSQQKQKETSLIFTNTLRIAWIVSIFFLLLGLVFSKQITAVLGADANVFSMTNIYLKVLLLFAPAVVFNDILICFIRNDGNPRLSMIAMLGGSLSNVVLDYVFIFLFQWGIFGAIFATGLAPVISILILSKHWLRADKGFHLVKTNWQREYVREFLSLGFPSLIMEISSGIVIVVFNQVILKLAGNIGVAAYGVIANLSLVVTAIYTGIAQGCQPLLSKAYGQQELRTIQKLMQYAIRTMIILSVLLYLLVYFYAEEIAGIFNSEQNQSLQEIAVYGLRIYFTAVVFTGFNILMTMLFTSTEKAVPAHIISIARGVAFIIPVTLILSFFWGMTGVWLAVFVSEVLAAVLVIGFYLYDQKKKKEI